MLVGGKKGDLVRSELFQDAFVCLLRGIMMGIGNQLVVLLFKLYT